MPLITEDSIRRVQESTDIVGLAESYGLSLRQTGSNFIALCPFHKEKTPSFNINPRMQIFKCFGCDAKGGVFKFVQMMDRCEFPEAVELLASRTGIDLEYEGGSSGPREADEGPESRKALRWANRLACEYFEGTLADAHEGMQARTYLEERGFTPETIRTWRLGWAPDRWDGLLRYVQDVVRSRSGEHKIESALAAGVAAGIFRQNDEGRIYDAFRGRVMFPILDSRDHVVGFGGRVFEEKPEAGGKYINTSEGKIFRKRELLFGLNFAQREIGYTKAVTVVEGYTDTIMCHQYGLRNTVATLGTSLTPDHVRLLRRYIRSDGRVIALFDADAAGQKATERAIGIFMEEDVPLYVCQSLEVKDACEYLPRFGEPAFREVLDAAQDSFTYMLRATVGAAASGDINARSQALETMMDLVHRSPNRAKLEMMRREVAAVAGIPVSDLPPPKTRPGTSVPSGAAGSAGAGRAGPQGGAGGRSTGTGDAPRRPPRGLGGASPTLQVTDQARWRRREERLAKFMLENREWARIVADRFPPDHWHVYHRFAAYARDAWSDDEEPDIGAYMRLHPAPESEDLAVQISGDEKPLSQEELDALLKKAAIEELEDELRETREELRRVGLDGDGARIDVLLQRQAELTQARDRIQAGG